MHILACVKQTPKSDNVKIDPATGCLIRSGVESAMNPFDEYALEEAVCLKEQLGGSVSVITMGPPAAENVLRDSIARMIEAYKHDVKLNYIYKAPMRPSSYFALFQTLGNRLIFNPRESEDDIKAFGAVATSWDTYHPGSLRGRNLHNIAIEGMRTLRIMRNREAAQMVDASKVSVANLIDIKLPDSNGAERSLTQLKGKVVMLDFHVFGADGSTKRIMQMRDIYNKYHARGFEIYQVALDPDEHFWKTTTAALPWVCVRDPQGLQSQYLALYNVQSIPTFFLIGRDNTLQKRDVQIKDLDAEIEALLK